LAQVAQVVQAQAKTAAHKETHHNLVLILRVLVVGMVENLMSTAAMAVRVAVLVRQWITELPQVLEHQDKATQVELEQVATQYAAVAAAVARVVLAATLEQLPMAAQVALEFQLIHHGVQQLELEYRVR
jgi:hypothetical protein